jgi:hypothetical protein
VFVADASGVIDAVIFTPSTDFVVYNDHLRTDATKDGGVISLLVKYQKKECQQIVNHVSPPFDVIYIDNQTKSDSLDKHATFAMAGVIAGSATFRVVASGLEEGDKVFYEVYAAFA